MTFLITGCFGFIGFNFINKLLSSRKKEINIIGIYSIQNNCSVKNHELSQKYENFRFINDDINNINSLDIKNINTIINFAAESHVDNSIYNPGLFIDSNIKGVSELLKYAIKNNVDNFLHVSTDEVYGSIQEGYFNEDDKLNPSSPYSASKASAELIINSFNKTYGYDVVMVRPANNYGIFQQPEKLIPFSIAKLVSGENVEIYGDGKNIRHWLHVDDTNEAILKILDSSIKTGVYNIGSDLYLSNIDLIKKLIEILKFDEEKISYVEDRPGHDFRYATDIKKLREIGWEPKADFEEELEITTNWYLNNKDWWEPGYQSILDFKREKRLGIV